MYSKKNEPLKRYESQGKLYIVRYELEGLNQYQECQFLNMTNNGSLFMKNISLYIYSNTLNIDFITYLCY